MVCLLDSNFQPLNIDDLPEATYTYVGKSSDGKKYSYQIDGYFFPFIERIQSSVTTFFKTRVPTGLPGLFSDHPRSQEEGDFWNQRRIMISSQYSFENNDTASYSLEDFKRLFYAHQADSLASEAFIHTHHLETVSRTVNLANRQLETLPKGIFFRWLDLEELRLNDNQFQRLPDRIGDLSKLQKLCLQNNRLRALPDRIGDLTYVRSLQLSHNQLETIPDRIGELAHLEELVLSDNRLETIPDSIGNLDYLKVLVISDNQLERLPDGIGDLSKLQKLWMNSNRLQALPDRISHLVNVDDLNLKNNQLRELPDSIGHLTSLELLDLSHNQFQIVPDSIADLVNLAVLDLSHNRLQTVPECLYRLPSTCGVSIENNPLSLQAIEQLRRRVEDSTYQGPQFTFSVRLPYKN